MAYSNEIYASAERILERRREKAESEAEKRAQEIKARLPEIERTERELYGVGLEISRLFLRVGSELDFWCTPCF